MDFEYLSDQILATNYLTKKDLIELLETNFNNWLEQGLLNKLSEQDAKKVSLMGRKVELLEKNADLDVKLEEAKSLRGTENEVSKRRYADLRTAKKYNGLELQKINMELNKINLIEKAKHFEQKNVEYQIIKNYLKETLGEEKYLELINQTQEA